MIRNKKNSIMLIITMLFAFLLVMPLTNVSAIAGSVYVGNEVLYDNDGDNTSLDGTVIYDYVNNTLTLDNYNGGEIVYVEEEDLTVILKGTNVITYENDGIGFEVPSANVKFTGDGSLTIDDVTAGIDLYEGNLEIDNTTININGLIGIAVDYGKLTINNASIDVDSAFFSTMVFDDIVINGGNLTFTSGIAGIIGQNNIVINDGYIESVGGIDGAGAAIVLIKFNGDPKLNIADNLQIFPEDTSIQELTLDYDGIPYDALSIGKDGASISLEGLDASTTNIAHEVIIKPKHKVSFDTNDGSDVDDQFLKTGEKVTQPNTPTKDGYLFVDWYSDDELTVPFDFDSTITEDTIIYAKWEKTYTYSYTFLSGDNQEFFKGKIDSYTFRIDGDYALFDSLEIGDLELISGTDYTVTEGSTIIEFIIDGINKLNTLDVGTYDVVVKYTNSKKASGKLIIKDEEPVIPPDMDIPTGEDPQPGENPRTGDNIISYLILGSISLFGIVGCGLYINRKKIVIND